MYDSWLWRIRPWSHSVFEPGLAIPEGEDRNHDGRMHTLRGEEGGEQCVWMCNRVHGCGTGFLMCGCGAGSMDVEPTFINSRPLRATSEGKKDL